MQLSGVALIVVDRFVAADPGLTRFLLAARVTLAVALTVVALAIGSTALDIPITVAILGAIVAMQASLAVTDPEPRTTTLLVPLPGTIGVVLGAIFASRGLVADVVFLAVLFCAVAVRLRGQRWTAFGTIAMMTYFFALFLGATIAALPALIAAVFVATVVTFTVRFILLPDQPGWIARRTIAAFEARIRFVVIAAEELLTTRDPGPARQRLVAAVQRLNETAASIEARLGNEASDEVRIIFDAELAAEDLATAAHALRDAAAPVPRALRLALHALGRGRAARAGRVAARLAHDHVVSHAAARELGAAIVDLGETIGRVDSATATLALSEAPWGGGAGVQQPVMRQAVQVTVASAAAIVVGEVLSPQRWYWAVLATYFVFIGTASSGETLERAWSRIAGTALGVAAGILVGHVAQGHPWLDVTALFMCLFLSVYFLRISHMIMIFFITALLALLYTLLGRFSDGLLGIRLVETAVGAVFGGLAATFILPTRTRDVVRARAQEALDAASLVVHASIGRLIDLAEHNAPLEAARVLEERVQQFIVRAKPAIGSPALIGTGHELRRWIVSLSAASYYARMLARVADRTPSPAPAAIVTLLRAIEERMRDNIVAAAGRVDDRYDAATTSTLGLFEQLRTVASAQDSAHATFGSAAHLLERLDRTIARLARDEGAIVELAPPAPQPVEMRGEAVAISEKQRTVHDQHLLPHEHADGITHDHAAGNTHAHAHGLVGHDHAHDHAGDETTHQRDDGTTHAPSVGTQPASGRPPTPDH